MATEGPRGRQTGFRQAGRVMEPQPERLEESMAAGAVLPEGQARASPTRRARRVVEPEGWWSPEPDLGLVPTVFPGAGQPEFQGAKGIRRR